MHRAIRSKLALDSSAICFLRNLFLSLPGASPSLLQARLRDGYGLALGVKDIRYYIDQFRLESTSTSTGTRLPRMRGKRRPPPMQTVSMDSIHVYEPQIREILAAGADKSYERLRQEIEHRLYLLLPKNINQYLDVLRQDIFR